MLVRVSARSPAFQSDRLRGIPLYHFIIETLMTMVHALELKVRSLVFPCMEPLVLEFFLQMTWNPVYEPETLVMCF